MASCNKNTKVLLTGAVGNTHAFVPGGEETWPIYVERLEIYFSANNIRNHNKQKDILLNVMGTSSYVTLRKLCAPQAPENLTYYEISNMLSDYYNPPSSKYVKRKTFNNRVQKEGESFASFVADLNGLGMECEFENFDDAIITQILAGMRDLGLKKHFILQKKNLTLEEVKKKGIASDIAYQNACKLQPVNQQQNKKMRSSHQQQQQQQIAVAQVLNNTQSHQGGNLMFRAELAQVQITECHRCGEMHEVNKCPHINKTCNYCKKKGHLINTCRKLMAKEARDAAGEDFEDDEWRDGNNQNDCCIVM